jgi:hypothetical protein
MLKSENVLVRYRVKQFIEIIENAKVLEEFDMDLYYKVIEKMNIYQENNIIVSLLDGTEIEVVIE